MRYLIPGVVLAICCVNAVATPVPIVDFKKLIDEADLICTGTVDAVSPKGKVDHSIGGQTYKVDRKVATVRCERIYKGSLKPHEKIQVEFLDAKDISMPYQTLGPEKSVLLLLAKADGPKEFKQINLYKWKWVVIPGSVSVDANADISEKIGAELEYTAEHEKGPVAEQAIQGLYQLDSKTRLAAAAKKGNPDSQDTLDGNVLALRIRHGDDAALDEANRLPVFESDRKGYTQWQGNILHEIGHISRTSARPQLNKLLESRNSGLRLEASESLKNIADKTSIPFLIECLADHRVDAAMNCLVALCRVTNRPGPGFADFKMNQASVEKEWREWWTQQKGKKTK